MSFFTVHSCVSPIFALNGWAFQNGTPLMRNSLWPASCGGSVKTTGTGVAPARGGGVSVREIVGSSYFVTGGSSVNAIVMMSSTLRYSMLP